MYVEVDLNARAQGGEEVEKEQVVSAQISEQEWQIIQLMREIDYGELVISMKGGKPIRVEEVRKSIQIK